MIGILGGVFDPVHNGHIHLAQEIHKRLTLDALYLMPTGEPVHRSPARISGVDRLAMLEAAIKDLPGLVADGREVAKGGPSYTLDTLVDIKKDLGPASVCLVLGADAFAAFERWHAPDSIAGLASFVIAMRPGTRRDAVESVIDGAGYLHRVEVSAGLTSAGAVLVEEIAAPDISSTVIRESIMNGESPDGQLPDAVMKIILAKQFYKRL